MTHALCWSLVAFSLSLRWPWLFRFGFVVRFAYRSLCAAIFCSGQQQTLLRVATVDRKGLIAIHIRDPDHLFAAVLLSGIQRMCLTSQKHVLFVTLHTRFMCHLNLNPPVGDKKP